MAEINWNLLDPNAAMKAAGSFQQGNANRLAMEQAQQEQQANALALQAKQQQAADANALRDIYKQSGGDVKKVISGMKQAGMYQPAMEMESKLAASEQEQQKLQLQRAKDTLSLIKDQSRFIMANPTLANATAALDQVQAATGQDMSQYKASILQLGDNPDAIRQWAAGHALEADKLLPHFEKFDTGGQIMSMTVDPITGRTVQTGAVKKTMTPGEIAKLEEDRRQFKLSQELEREKIGAKAQGNAAIAKEQAQAAQALPNIESSANMAIQNIDELLKHPGFSSSVGAGVGHITKHVPGTDAADFNARLEQLQGGAFLQAFNSLKGGGQITEIEGKKATSAITRMSTAQSEKEFKKAAEEFKQVIQTGLNNARKAAGKQSVEYGAHPSDIQNLLDKYGG